MIISFIEHYRKNEQNLREFFIKHHPEDYKQIVVKVIETIVKDLNEYDYLLPDPTRVLQIDHGDYQGTLLFIIGAQGYQPNDYWWVKISYGSCSGCDTLQRIKDDDWGSESVTTKQVDQYMTLALHILQGLKLLE
jgi:hypothetical protein